MILHTIISEQDVFGTPYANSMDNAVSPQLKTKRIRGGFAEMKNYNGEFKIERIFSTDPSVYLGKNIFY